MKANKLILIVMIMILLVSCQSSKEPEATTNQVGGVVTVEETETMEVNPLIGTWKSEEVIDSKAYVLVFTEDSLMTKEYNTYMEMNTVSSDYDYTENEVTFNSVTYSFEITASGLELNDGTSLVKYFRNDTVTDKDMFNLIKGSIDNSSYSGYWINEDINYGDFTLFHFNMEENYVEAAYYLDGRDMLHFYWDILEENTDGSYQILSDNTGNTNTMRLNRDGFTMSIAMHDKGEPKNYRQISEDYINTTLAEELNNVIVEKNNLMASEKRELLRPLYADIDDRHITVFDTMQTNNLLLDGTDVFGVPFNIEYELLQKTYAEYNVDYNIITGDIIVIMLQPYEIMDINTDNNTVVLSKIKVD